MKLPDWESDVEYVNTLKVQLKTHLMRRAYLDHGTQSARQCVALDGMEMLSA
jgi:hypothetical protein